MLVVFEIPDQDISPNGINLVIQSSALWNLSKQWEVFPHATLASGIPVSSPVKKPAKNPRGKSGHNGSVSEG